LRLRDAGAERMTDELNRVIKVTNFKTSAWH
jgi:hypothetical protein